MSVVDGNIEVGFEVADDLEEVEVALGVLAIGS